MKLLEMKMMVIDLTGSHPREQQHVLQQIASHTSFFGANLIEHVKVKKSKENEKARYQDYGKAAKIMQSFINV
jgi:hypothetical protein